VIIAGCVEGLLPTAPDLDASPAERQSALEEQRRLFFVGLTRVRALPGDNKPGVLVLTCSRSMSLADAMQSGIHPASVRFGRAYVLTSRFIRELGPAAPASEAG
jgi:DNA helicase II / ATP-dependent DNA helicase PcrA